MGWHASDLTLHRLSHALITGWLSIWKAGSDQARLHADALVDLRVERVPLAATWLCRFVAEEATDRLLRDEVGAALRATWLEGGSQGRETLEWRGVVDPWAEEYGVNFVFS